MRAKRRRFDPAFKAKIGLEALKGIKTVAEITREYQVHPNHVSQWKSEVVQRLPEVFEHGPTAQAQEQVQEIERLERKVGQLTMELDWLKKSPDNWACKGARGAGGKHWAMRHRGRCTASPNRTAPSRPSGS